MRKSTDNVLKSYRSFTDLRSPIARPACNNTQKERNQSSHRAFDDIISPETRMEERAYSNGYISCRDETNQSRQKEDMVRYIDYRRSQIDKQIRQRWRYPQKQHIVQKLISTLTNLNIHKNHKPINQHQMKDFTIRLLSKKGIFYLSLKESQFLRP